MTLKEEDSSDPASPQSAQRMLTELFNSLATVTVTPTQVQQLSPAALAYVGDAVYELYVRTYYLFPPKRLRTYHQNVVAHVRAETQALHARSLEPHLTPSELDLLRRGRNAASGRPKRIDANTYQQATGLETLLGYLYLSDPQRLADLLSYLELSPMLEE